MSDNNRALYGTSLVKAFSILTYLSQHQGLEGVTEISRATQMGKSTAYKLLDTLQSLNLVERDTTAPTYRLGVAVIKLARGYLSTSNELLRFAQPLLQALNTRTGETIHLGVLSDDEVVYLSKIDSPQAVRMQSSVGNTSPLYCTGLGKALLSRLDAADLARYFERTPLVPFTKQTIRTETALKYDLEQARRRGFAIDNAEHSTDVRCVAVAIEDATKLHGAISISAPSYRMDDAMMDVYVAMLCEARDTILADLTVQDHG